MKKFLAVLALMALSACSNKQPAITITDTTQKVQTQTTGQAVDQVAGDKELLRQAIVLADSKGTLVGALTEAAQDSLVGPKMREALALSNQAKRETTPAPKGPARHAGSGDRTTSQKQKGDAIDQANSGLDKANREIDKGTQTINKAGDIGRKLNEVFHR